MKTKVFESFMRFTTVSFKQKRGRKINNGNFLELNSKRGLNTDWTCARIKTHHLRAEQKTNSLFQYSNNINKTKTKTRTEIFTEAEVLCIV